MSLVGLPQDQLDTPALCVDLDALEANIAQVATICREHKVGWRPHAKCHKSVEVGRKLLAAGASGLTCAKLGEAEVFAAAGIRDLLIANMLAGPEKVRRLVELRRIADPIFCVDSIAQAEPVSRAMTAAGLRVRTILEIDIGMHRVGVQPGEPALALARQVAALPGLEFSGIMGYEGHLLLLEDQAEKARAIGQSLALLTGTHDLLVQNGLPCPIVSCGGTGSLHIAAAQPGITEMQAGGAIFMDAFYRHRCRVPGFRYALLVLTTIVSRPAPDRAIVDAGRKTMNMELAPPFVLQEGGTPSRDIEFVTMSAEHGIWKLHGPAQELPIGTRLWVVPGYSDFTTVLHDQFLALRDGKVAAIWPLQGRGKLQ